MSNFRKQLFHEFAAKGISTSVGLFKDKHQPKKESRFNVDGITYEIGPARLQEDHIEFEISSKIPQDELKDRSDFERYFSDIKGVLASDSKQPEEIGMDNIVHDLGSEEAKERDYVRLLYCFQFDDMYDPETLSTELERLQKDPSARELPDIPNVNTVAGRLLLLCVEDFVHQEATHLMDRLIEANQQVRQGKEAPKPRKRKAKAS
ncbi:MAG: hypothetical protein V3S24_06995 [Candidatus Tectomicrobia bacterium]